MEASSAPRYDLSGTSQTFLISIGTPSGWNPIAPFVGEHFLPSDTFLPVRLELDQVTAASRPEVVPLAGRLLPVLASRPGLE